MIRIVTAFLLLVPIYGVGKLSLAEWHYARGMASADLQVSVDHLTDAAVIYPADFKFRSAQARQLFALVDKLPEIAEGAAESLRLAVEADPGASDLVSMLLAVQRRLGRCDQAKATADRLVALAWRSDMAKTLAALPCSGK